MEGLWQKIQLLRRLDVPGSAPLQAWQQQWEAGGEAAAAVGAGDDAAAAAALDECCQLAESLGEQFYPNENRWAGPCALPPLLMAQALRLGLPRLHCTTAGVRSLQAWVDAA